MSQGESGPTDYPYYDSPWNWGWDYWTEGGAWVAWDSVHRGQWPFPQWQGLANGDTGVVSLNVSIHNYYAYELKTRVFWVCFPSGLNPVGSETISPAAASAAAPDTGGVTRTGTEGADRLQGGGGRDDLVGLAGDDGLSGLAGEDHLQGGPGHDKLSGGSGNDLLHGFAGKDKAAGGKGADDVLAGRGNDRSLGGPGPDEVFDDKGRDLLRGGPGNDRFAAHDGDRDRIDCGPGEDIAWIDRLDVATGCEHVYRTKREAPKKPPKI
jgi:Ca2+-binding RTX toxin-like protein